MSPRPDESGGKPAAQIGVELVKHTIIGRVDKGFALSYRTERP